MVLQVQVTHMGNGGRKYRVRDVTPRGADEMTFFNEKAGRDMTVQEYFEQCYHIK